MRDERDPPLTAPAADPASDLRAKIRGYWVSQCLYVAAQLSVPDHLGESGCSVDALAQATGTPPETMRRLLRALASVGILTIDDREHCTLSEAGRLLRGDVPGTLRPELLHMAHPSCWAAWAGLGHSLRTGDESFTKAHGIPAWEYRTQHPYAALAFRAMAAAAAERQRSAILAALHVPDGARVVDVGGGSGELLAALLDRHLSATGVVFESAGADEAARATIETRGLHERMGIVTGSFLFESPPAADLVILKSVLHNWDDAHAATILARCRCAVRPGGRLIVIERVLDTERPEHDDLMDLHMLVIHGGRERTIEDYRRLISAAGLRLIDRTPLYPVGEPRVDLLQAEPVDSGT